MFECKSYRQGATHDRALLSGTVLSLAIENLIFVYFLNNPKIHSPPSSILSNIPPKPNTIPEQNFASSILLFNKVYGFEKLFTPILLATNCNLKTKYPNERECTLEELKIAFGMRISAALFRSKNHPMYSFWE